MAEEIVPIEESQKEEIATPVEEKKEKRWLKIVLFSILGIVLAAGLVFAGYKLAQIKQVQPGPQPTPTPEAVATPTPDETANWKTYTNTKYGYSIKYPPDWGIIKGEETAEFISKPEYVEEIKQIEPPERFTKDDYAFVSVSIRLKGTATKAGKIEEDTKIEEFVPTLYGSDLILETKPSFLSGRSAFEFMSKRLIWRRDLPGYWQDCPQEEEPCMVQEGTVHSVWTKINGNLLSIGYQYMGGYTEVEELVSTFNLMLSTFKFVE